MIGRALAMLVMASVIVASPAFACDPYSRDCWRWLEDATEEVEPSPQEPLGEPGPVLVPIAPEGLHLVTEVYVADIVWVAGPLITYGTETVSETPGTYARVVDTVGTGVASAYDGSAFNGRAALDDGRSVAGAYYESFVLSGGAFVPISVVFFQDDSFLRQPVRQPAPSPASGPASTKLPMAATSPAPLTVPRVPVIRAGVSTSPLVEPRTEIEVLRGRAIRLWIRAAVDGVTQPVGSWQIRSGDHVALGPSSGDGDDPFIARWDVVTPPGTAWTLAVETTTAVDGLPHVSVSEVIVVVRSPALIR